MTLKEFIAIAVTVIFWLAVYLMADKKD